MSSIVIQGDTSGSITVEAPSVAGTHTLTLPKATGNIATDATVGLGMKNRIINGGMVIDQRNAGASVTVTNDIYTIDRYKFPVSQNSTISCEQVTDAPTGFKNSMKITSLAASTVGVSDYWNIWQMIEGYNIADLAWGSASAKTVTLSFWVKSSLTGTHGGALQNEAQNRSYPFTYTISSANTWEQKSITIAGDTTGTWDTDNTVGIRVQFSLGVGSNFANTAGSWTGAQSLGATGQVNIPATNGATWYITGLQLEQSDNSTPFENRMYSTELALCQRYYFRGGNGGNGIFNGGTSARYCVNFPTTMRAYPSITAIAAPKAINPLVAESQTGSQTLLFSVTGYGESANYAVAQIQFGGFSSGADGRPTTLLNTCLQFSAEL